jgi:delta(3,5)-delta(2,4)-dienoyl-CoA isomerase
VSKVVEGGRDEVVKSALELAKFIATKSPIAVSSSKHLLTHSRDHRYESLPCSSGMLVIFFLSFLKQKYSTNQLFSSSVPENLAYTSTWNGAALMTNVSFQKKKKDNNTVSFPSFSL